MSLFTKILLAVLVVDLSLLLFTWRNWGDKQKSNTLVIGVWVAGYPYAAINQHGSLDGFDIDLSYKLAQKLEKTIIFKDMPFDLLCSSLKIENIDLIGSSLVITKKRLATMDMIDVYGKPKAEITLIFWQQIPENIQTIEDLKNQTLHKPVAARAESFWAEILDELAITNVISLEQYHDLVLPIQYGQAIAVAVGPRHALALQKQFPEIKILKIPLEKPWGEGVGLGVKKGNVKLKEQLEKAVKELKEDGTIAALKKKWFGEGAE